MFDSRSYLYKQGIIAASLNVTPSTRIEVQMSHVFPSLEAFAKVGF